MFTTTNQTKFNALAAKGYNRIPLVLETFADLDTPLSLYLKLANQPFSYLLESVQGGERFGRYSIIGLPAKTRLKCFNEIERIGIFMRFYNIIIFKYLHSKTMCHNARFSWQADDGVTPKTLAALYAF